MNLIETLKPCVGKFWLYFTAVVVWSGVGIYLVMFKRFADQNITRIREMNGNRICFFDFQRWTSYPLVVIMMSMGVYLRLYAPIPKPYLAILYLGIGSSLFIASFRYYRTIFNQF